GIRDGHVTGVQTCALPISKAQSRGSRSPGEVDQPVEYGLLDDQLFLSRLREPLDCAFDSQSKAPGADDPLKHKMERPPASKRFRAFARLPRVFRDPTTHVSRNASVESAI